MVQPTNKEKIPATEAKEAHAQDFVVNDELLTIHPESTRSIHAT
jgi:hypothetical protein